MAVSFKTQPSYQNSKLVTEGGGLFNHLCVHSVSCQLLEQPIPGVYVLTSNLSPLGKELVQYNLPINDYCSVVWSVVDTFWVL